MQNPVRLENHKSPKQRRNDDTFFEEGLQLKLAAVACDARVRI